MGAPLSMKFCELSKAYPWIYDYIDMVSELIYSKQFHPIAAVESVQRRNALELLQVDSRHMSAFIGKLLQFAWAIYKPSLPPDACPRCGSTETDGAVCTWCHNPTARE